MTRLALDHNTAFQLAIGDNFYTKGIQGVDDKRFQVNHFGQIPKLTVFFFNFNNICIGNL